MNGMVLRHPSLAIWAAMTLLLSSTAVAQKQPEVTASTVVFVCEHGAAKSVIAAAQFNRLAAQKGLPYRAVSRGTKPDEAVAPAVRIGLASEGMDVSAWRPTAVTDQEVRRAAQVVSLGTDLAATNAFAKSKVLEWNDIPSVTQNYEAARSAIFLQVASLVENLLTARKQ
jgi:arsenate reductase